MGSAKHILVVEDERVVARDIQRSLTDLGYEVPATAASADQAIHLASERCPDLVLMDIRIKGDLDGIQAAEILRKRFDVPVVYLTAYADGPTVDRAKATEPLGYLLKPVKADELRRAVELALYKHEMEKRLRERERWLTTTLRSIGNAVISADPEGRVNYMNPVAEAMTGKRLEAAIGRPCRDVLQLVDACSRASMENPMEQALRAGKTVNVEGSLANPDSGEHLVSNSTSPIVDDRGRILGAVMVFRDVSEQKRLQRQFELADRLASVGTMAAGVAHEVNNPLAFILGNVGFALDELHRHKDELAASRGAEGAGWTDELESALQDAQSGAERVRRIVADLKAFCGTDPGKTGKVDVHEVLEWALDVAAHELRPKARIMKDFGAAPIVEAESTRLGQVFVHVLLNAAHAMSAEAPDGNEMKIATRTDGAGRAVIELRDTGSGMPAEVLSRAFEPFFTTKDVGQGPGLGLSICHGIVKSLGGEIEIESDLGKGTVVRVVLPAARTKPIDTERKLELPIPEGPRGYLLVVDDEPMTRWVLHRTLGSEHMLTCPKTSTEALALIDAGMRFDLILCDLMMPDLTGIDLHRHLLDRHPDQARRMVFMLGRAVTPHTMEFMRSVPNRRTEKPFAPSQLRRLVRELVREYGLIHREERAS